MDLELVIWNSQSGNSRGRESLEFPLEFPAQKRPFSGNSLEFPGIPIQRGFLCIQRGFLCIQRGFLCTQKECFGFVSYQNTLRYLYLSGSFAAVVADDTAIRASPALEERNNEATARDVTLQSPILPIVEILASKSTAGAACYSHLDAKVHRYQAANGTDDTEAAVPISLDILDAVILLDRKETTTNSIKLYSNESSRTSLTGLSVLLRNTMFIFTPMKPVGSEGGIGFEYVRDLHSDLFSSIASHSLPIQFELELELIQTQMAQKPMLRAEVGMRVRCANKASAE